MKLFGSRWLLLISVAIILLISQHRSAAESVAAEAQEEGSSEHGQNGEHGHHHEEDGETHDDHPDHQHEHSDHEEKAASISGEDSSSLSDHEHHHHEGHHPVVRGHGESCGGDDEDAATCDTAAGLNCLEQVCECDKSAGEVYSAELGKCQHAPPQVIPEVHDNSLEGEGNTDEEEGSKEGDGDGAVHGNEEENGVTTTTTTQAPVVVPDKENSLEEEIDYNRRPVQTIQHRTEGKEEEDTDKEESEEEPVPVEVAGKCANVNCEETLGRYSKCDEETGECDCNDVEGSNRPLLLKNGKCVINRRINDPCSNHEDCTATIAGRAWCHLDMSTYNRFCQCEQFNYYDDAHKECLTFATDGLFSPCKTDMQCTGLQGANTGHGLGPNARCSPDKGTCECKVGPDGQKGFMYDNYCFYQMMPEEHCDLDMECQVSFPQQDVGCIDSQCKCRNGENITTVSCQLESSDILEGFQRKVSIFGEGGSSDEEPDGFIDSLKASMGLELSNFVFIMIIGAVVVLAVIILSVFVVRKRHKYSMVRTREPAEEPASPI